MPPLSNCNISKCDEIYLKSIKANTDLKNLLIKDQRLFDSLISLLESDNEAIPIFTASKKYLINVLKILEPDNEIATILIGYLGKSTAEVLLFPRSMIHRFMTNGEI